MNERRKITRGIMKELEGHIDPQLSEPRASQLVDDIAGAVMAELGFEDEE